MTIEALRASIHEQAEKIVQVELRQAQADALQGERIAALESKVTAQERWTEAHTADDAKTHAELRGAVRDGVKPLYKLLGAMLVVIMVAFGAVVALVGGKLSLDPTGKVEISGSSAPTVSEGSEGVQEADVPVP